MWPRLKSASLSARSTMPAVLEIDNGSAAAAAAARTRKGSGCGCSVQLPFGHAELTSTAKMKREPKCGSSAKSFRAGGPCVNIGKLAAGVQKSDSVTHQLKSNQEAGMRQLSHVLPTNTESQTIAPPPTHAHTHTTTTRTTNANASKKDL